MNFGVIMTKIGPISANLQATSIPHALTSAEIGMNLTGFGTNFVNFSLASTNLGRLIPGNLADFD